MTGQDACALRRAGPGDATALESFLAQHATTSMFLRSNLAAHGTEEDNHPHGTAFYIPEDEAEVSAVFAITNHGYLGVQNPSLIAPLVQLRRLWAGRRVLGMTGDAAQVTPVLDVLGLQDAPVSLNRDEPLYDMALNALAGPFEELRAPTSADNEILCLWFADYLRDTGFSGDETLVKSDAQERAMQGIDRARLRIMELEGRPVAMTDFNAQVADIVQIGGVFVPKNLRNTGYGRRVVAAHLAEARGRGINRAILFAANAAAARAYEGIGFRLIGTYRVVLFERPVSIPHTRPDQGDV